MILLSWTHRHDSITCSSAELSSGWRSLHCCQLILRSSSGNKTAPLVFSLPRVLLQVLSVHTHEILQGWSSLTKCISIMAAEEEAHLLRGRGGGGDRERPLNSSAVSMQSQHWGVERGSQFSVRGRYSPGYSCSELESNLVQIPVLPLLLHQP